MSKTTKYDKVLESKGLTPTREAVNPGTTDTQWTRTDGVAMQGVFPLSPPSQLDVENTSTAESVVPYTFWQDTDNPLDFYPVYQKVVDLGGLPSAAPKNNAHGITGQFIKSFRIIEAWGTDVTGGQNIPLPFVHNNGGPDSIQIISDLTNIVLNSTQNWGALTGKAIVRWSKTADTALTEKQTVLLIGAGAPSIPKLGGYLAISAQTVGIPINSDIPFDVVAGTLIQSGNGIIIPAGWSGMLRSSPRVLLGSATDNCTLQIHNGTGYVGQKGTSISGTNVAHQGGVDGHAIHYHVPVGSDVTYTLRVQAIIGTDPQFIQDSTTFVMEPF